ncbi:hypothetical protein MCHIJ_32760 [Mycolicibacterium chitae]|uniref:Uncharacterized protein n=2 Tax=Mycolicibacterium TaxID=1866885 RepID=A0A3S4VH60_MYCCI|nr:ATP-binding protein [Mycolicibacterium chitae]MCV7105308.1 sensor histidine kinase [Mycolicibacterium chitae]BBZ03839.1 hypothetical protein MCHIJ_32760 [Mycolicibacterium chitae]VEG47490.1 Uncharacterised protein [Mycolicibacterium chitae]
MKDIQPLKTLTDDAAAAWIKQRVTNVIKSYHNAADVIAEPIQNAVDEVLSAESIGDTGQVRIVLDTDEDRIAVWDNGRGIGSDIIERYLAPDVGSKREAFLKGLVRGHKGVGLTFLAYGFNFFEVESRTSDEHYRVRIEGGRSWVESTDSSVEPPIGKLSVVGVDVHDGRLAAPGTIVTIGLGPLTEPRSLRHAFPSIDYAATAIRNQTAIGIVEPPAITKKRKLVATLEYRAHGNSDSRDVPALYRYPHMDTRAGVRTLDLGNWLKKNRGTEPQAKERKAYHACYMNLSPDDLLELIKDRHGEKLVTSEEVSTFVRQHEVSAYCLFSYSASYRDQIREAWNIPGNRKFLYSPSLRIATDGMISSWSREIALTHRGFNVDRTWIVYSMRGIEPDLGRKDFPPEVKDFIAITEELIANDVANKSRPFLRIAPPRSSGTPSGYVSPAVKAYQRRQRPLNPRHIPGFGDIQLATEPVSEQDVIALFNELVGMGILCHLRPVFYSGFDYYDSYFEYAEAVTDSQVRELLPGITDVDEREREGVAEFKFNADSIIDDIVASIKKWTDMTFLLCWEIGKNQRSLGGDEITIDEPSDPASRRYHGITHIGRLQSGGDHTVFILALKDFLRIVSADS